MRLALVALRYKTTYPNPTFIGTALSNALQRSNISSTSATAPQQQQRAMAGRASSREWTPPDGVDDPKARPPGALVLYNSLLDEKVPFVPAGGPHSKSIGWYTCGPTVYDSAHMGHARNYVTWDIVRRVIEDYFGYNVMYVMNVTDVDDKIILRARRNHLLAEYKAAGKSPSEVYAFATAALQAACKKQEGKVDAAAELVKQAAEELQSQQSGESSSGCGVPHKSASQLTRRKDDLETALKNEQYKLDAFREAATELAALGRGADADSVLALAGDFVAEALDQQHGASVSDPAIFRAHAAKYEREFFEDMDALGCRRPDVLTRVSEYITEIIDYVQKIADNGIAYEANGSVYFDTVAYRAKGHTYGKLNPWSVGTSSLASEGEANFETSEKRCPNDFALWKASKPGEPMWESPWGPGRPGWHIECSAMASSVLGPKLDIHTGGEDLRFPHHDNELAQAEAHYHTDGCRQWVNYFLHAGHLSIEGLKMSKSLKNFITIREALRTFTSRQLRLMFALVPFHKPMCYGEQSRQEMSKKEQMFRNFFQNVDVAVRANDLTHTAANWQDEDKQLAQQIQQAQQDVHDALLDSINTAAALHKLSELVSAVNTYLKEKEDKKLAPSQLLLTKAAAYVTRILSALGIVDAPADKPGFGATQDGAAAASSAAAKYLDTLAAFRDEVRGLAKNKSEPRDVLTACDRIRDDTLVELGVRLEDKPDGKSVWKLDDPAVLKAEAAERAAAAAEAARKKLEGALDRKAKEKEKFEKLLALPSIEESLADKYSKFDADTSEPTHDKDGKELDGKAKDKARKDVEKARKVREPLEKRRAEDPEFMAKLEEEIRELSAQLAALAKPAL